MIQLTELELQALWELAARAPKSTAEAIFIEQIKEKANDQLMKAEKKDG